MLQYQIERIVARSFDLEVGAIPAGIDLLQKSKQMFGPPFHILIQTLQLATAQDPADLRIPGVIGRVGKDEFRIQFRVRCSICGLNRCIGGFTNHPVRTQHANLLIDL